MIDVAPPFPTVDIASDPLGRALSPGVALLEVALREAKLRVEIAERALETLTGRHRGEPRGPLTGSVADELREARKLWAQAYAALAAARRGAVP
jgi:hypothetical protein